MILPSIKEVKTLMAKAKRIPLSETQEANWDHLKSVIKVLREKDFTWNHIADWLNKETNGSLNQPGEYWHIRYEEL